MAVPLATTKITFALCPLHWDKTRRLFPNI
jgi:hypothetical protein